jgi:xylulose-5-phosphate/fructose-6-phosphate phosphoketolase
VLARIPHEELESLLVGYGYRPYFVEGDEPPAMHRQMVTTLDAVLDELARIQHEARASGKPTRPCWPLIVLQPQGVDRAQGS